jgi:tripartite-type tricarboxylate transporter receptor subunit TctC
MEMKPTMKKSFLCILTWSVFVFSFLGIGYSQEEDVAKFPTRPITFVNPIAANSPTDMAIRLISREAEKFLGQPVVVVNKVGPATTIGIAFLASSKPDGYTIGFAAHSGLFVVPFMQKLSYHPVQDLTPILQWSGLNIGIAVKGDSPFRSLKDLVQYARQNPKKVNYGTNGLNMQHIITQQIGNREKVEFTNVIVPGTAELEAAILKGEIVFGVGQFTASAIESGQFRFLVLLKDEPSNEYPDVPILKHLGYEIPCPMTLNIFAPKGINPVIVKKLEDAFTKVMKEPEFINGMKKLHIPIVYRSSKEFGEYVALSFEVYSKSLKEMGLTK